MATNKHALIRYKILDKCFRNPGKRYFLSDLMAEVDKVLMEIHPDIRPISRRQIFDDMTFMKSSDGWDAEIESIRNGKRVYYRYQNPKFSINNMPLNALEINQLKSAFDILAQFKGVPQFDWMDALLAKLQEGIEKSEPNKIIEFDNNQYLKGIEHLGVLFNAILYRKVLNIKYKPFGDEAASVVEIHPYYLKQYNNRWFLFGFNPVKDKPDWNMAIDRMEDIKEFNVNYIENETIVWQEYFEDMIGVTRPENQEPEKIILQFNNITGKYIETKPLHGSQKSRWINPETLEVSLKLLINYELEWLILSYADSAKVLEPQHLAVKINHRLQTATCLYAANDFQNDIIQKLNSSQNE